MDFSDLHVKARESETFLPCVSKITKMEMVMVDHVGHSQFCELCAMYNVLG